MWKEVNKHGKWRNGYVWVPVLLSVLLYGCGAGNREVILLEEALVSAESSAEIAISESMSEQVMVYVHVCGAVKFPGVVEVAQGSRVEAAVEAAGGFTDEADKSYVNLAAVLADGEQIYIPTVEEVLELAANRLEAPEDGLVNLNTADVAQLCTLPGIGEARAGDIIFYRQEHGGFTSVEELMNVTGIKDNIYNRIKDRVTVE